MLGVLLVPGLPAAASAHAMETRTQGRIAFVLSQGGNSLAVLKSTGPAT